MRTTKNERCPLQAECERSCEFQHRELECNYYRDNARCDLVIEDQEKIRNERDLASESEMWEAAMAELPEDDLEEDKPRDIEAIQAETPHTLDELASDIRAFSGSILFSAIEIGRRMVEAKKMLPHGEFGKWVKEKTGYSQTKANNFMRLFREYGSAQNGILEAGANYHTYGNLSYSNALALLDLPSDERNSFVEENNVIDMSARELDKAIRERKEALAAAEEAEAKAKTAEEARAKMESDMVMLKGLLDSAKAETASATEEAGKLARELEELKSKPVEVAVMQVDQDALDKARSEAVAGMQEKLDKAMAAKKKAEEKRKAAEDALADANAKLEAAQSEERKAVIAGDKDLATFELLFSQAQEQINKLHGMLLKVRGRGDTDLSGKLQKALLALSDLTRRCAE